MKNLFKKIISLVLTLVLVCGVLAGCGSTGNSGEGSSSGDKLQIGVIQYMSHPSLDNCYQGVEEALTEKYGDDVEIDRQIGSDASADADCETYAKMMVANGYDMIIAIATPAATSAYAATEASDIPVVFCAVSDPVTAQLVSSLETPGGACTGTSDILDMEAQVDLIQSLQPDVKSIGVLYTTSEANSITQLEMLREVASARGISVEASGVQGASDIPAAAAALVQKVDCINNFTDNNVVNNLQVLIEAANGAGIPVYGSEIEQVKNGCLASASIDYVALGRETGNMAVEVLEGADISTMSVRTISEATPVINTDVLTALNIELPAEYADAETVTTNK